MDHAVEFCPHGKRETVILALAWFCIGHQAVSYTHLDVYKRQANGCEDPGRTGDPAAD